MKQLGGEDGWEKLSLLALFGSSDAFTAGLRSSPLGMGHGQAVNSGVRSELVGNGVLLSCRQLWAKELLSSAEVLFERGWR